MATRPDICIYHSPCPDGHTAAWAVWLKWPDIKFHPAGHGNSPPDVTGLHVLIVDFSYPKHVLEKMLATAASITILDHHKTAEASLKSLLDEGTLQGEFDMLRSGAMMAWQYIWPEDEINPYDTEGEISDYDSDNNVWLRNGTKGHIPLLVHFIQDRDLWTWKLTDSRAVLAFAQGVEQTFEGWSQLATDLENPDRYRQIVEIGTYLVDKQHNDTLACIKAAQRRMDIGGYNVPVANLPYIMASDAGNIMCKGEPFAASYFDNGKGERVFSLRSDNTDPMALDVSAIAKFYDGGGHHHASGFKMPQGWEGDPPTIEVEEVEIDDIIELPVTTILIDVTNTLNA